MKDLRDYYRSPPKPETVVKVEVRDADIKLPSTQNTPEGEKSREIASVDKNKVARKSYPTASVIANSRNGFTTTVEAPNKDDDEAQPTIQGNEKNTKRAPKSSKKRGKKPKVSRKPSDPAVKNITELLNASLNIISPNASINVARRDSSSFDEKSKSSKFSSTNKKSRQSSSGIQSAISSKKRESLTSMYKSKVDDDRASHKTCSDADKQTRQKPRRSSSDFETPRSAKKLISDKSTSDKNNVDSDKNSLENSSHDSHLERERSVKCKDSCNVPTKSSKRAGKMGTLNGVKIRDHEFITSNESVKSGESKSTNDTLIEVKNEVIILDCVEESNSTADSRLDDLQGTPRAKVNAFQFMMESRFKSIGQNVTGKEISNELNTQEETEKRQKRLSRKHMLENWAESKGDVKRKRKKEEDKDIYINYQLEKRAKRLKKLLNSNDNSKENINEHHKEPARKSSRKHIMKPVIDSDSESSLDVSNKDSDVRDNKVSSNVVNTSPASVGSLLTSNINNISNTNKAALNQNGLLNFLGITNKLKDQDSEKQELEKDDPNILKRNKKSIKKSKKRNSKLALTKPELAHEENANVDMHCVYKESDQPPSKSCTLKTETTDVMDDLNMKGNTVECHSSVYNCERSCSQDSISSLRKGFQTPNTKKHKKRENIEDHLLGRSPRSWKMRIRLTSDDEGTSTNEATISKLVQKNNNEPSEELENKTSIDDEAKSEIRERPKRKVTQKRTEILFSSDSEDEVEIVTPQKKSGRGHNLKVAPVFIKAAPKPKVDPKVAEARREFLMSGVPDQLKRDIEKQISVEEIEFDVFPVISHVQQRCGTNPFWSLPSPEMKLASPSQFQEDTKNIIYKGLTLKNTNETTSLCKPFQKVEICRQLIKNIKSRNVSYPVYKSFKSIYEKSGLKDKKEPEAKATASPKKEVSEKKKGKKHKKKDHNDSVEIIETSKDNIDSTLAHYTMWTEKYKPIFCSDIIGNTNSVLQLKKWLERWIDPNEDSRNRNKRKRNCSTSESEFEYMDSDSRESTSESRNTVILKGPCGSGKSSAVYAICNEFGMNVLELNASSKRTGRRLLQELQEATRSHQVMKGESAMLSQFIKPEKSKENLPAGSQNSERNKICVLLVEDLDIIFEQDEGFLSALTQLISTSKRPIILTTTDNTSQIICRFTSLYPVIDFKPLSVHSSAVWLQILCLVEGVSLDLRTIEHMLDKNRGDIRKTMLELQYLVQTGDNSREDKKNVIPSRIASNKQPLSEEKLCDDDNSNLSFIIDNPDCQGTLENRADCHESFEGDLHGIHYNIPYKMSASKIWWNLPDILSLKSFRTDAIREDCLNHQQASADEQNPNVKKNQRMKRLENKRKLGAICDIYESLVLSDLTKGKRECLVDLEPCPRQWDNVLKDSLELTENFHNYSINGDLTEDICHTLANGYMENYKKLHGHSYEIHMGVPSMSNIRWREKQHLCEDILQDALSFSNYVQRRAVSVDFMPVLRQIGRSETTRASQNIKRGNRFNNYLRGLGVDGGDSSYKIVCDVLNVDNFKSSCS